MTRTNETRLKILISGHEICGLIQDLAEELESRGHEVTTIAMPHRFYPYRYDYDQYRFVESVLAKRSGVAGPWPFLLKLLWEVGSSIHQALEKWLRIRLASTADLYLRVWGEIPFDEEVLRAVKKRGVPVATFLMGSDVRDYDVFAKQYGVTRWTFPAEYRRPALVDKLRTLRRHERYADAIFSVPDQMGLALRPYHHLQIPISLERIRFNIPGRAIPRVVHAPSSPHVKGTDVIEAALNTLRAEGIAFDFLSLREMPHSELLDVLTDADVLIDEIILHGPGWLSFEAMASGCAVATRVMAEAPDCFQPPVWPIDERTIVDQLRKLLTSPELRTRLAAEGRTYTEQHNTVRKVTDRILETTLAGGSVRPDYYPEYLTTSFVPANEAEAAVINESSATVSGEAWYRDRVARRSHDGLTF